MRLLLPFILFARLLHGSTEPSLTRDPLNRMGVSPQWIEGVERSIVKVTTESGVCTGFVVDAAKGWVLTARHCVVQDQPVFINNEPTKILNTSEMLALLSAPEMTRPPLDLRKDRIPVGESVVSFGYGYGWLQVMQRHIASWFEGDILLDAPVSPGMSGGPVVDLDGRVVGINQSIDPNRTLTNACGVDEIRAFLQ